MPTTVLSVIGAVLACIIGAWKLFGRKSAEKRARVDAADKEFQEGVASEDKSKIIAGINDLHNS